GPGQFGGEDHLQGDLVAGLPVPGEVDDAHAPFVNAADDLVVAEPTEAGRHPTRPGTGRRPRGGPVPGGAVVGGGRRGVAGHARIDGGRAARGGGVGGRGGRVVGRAGVAGRRRHGGPSGRIGRKPSLPARRPGVKRHFPGGCQTGKRLVRGREIP